MRGGIVQSALDGHRANARSDSTVGVLVSLGFSGLFYPLVVPIPGGVLLLSLDGYPLAESIGWMGLCLAVTVLPLGGYVSVMRQQGQSTHVRANRQRLYGLGIGLTTVLLGLLGWLGAPQALLVGCLGGVLTGSLFALANRYTKVSLHVGVLAGMAILVTTISPTPTVVAGSVVCVSAVAASRYLLGRHTVVQIALGFLLAAIGIGVPAVLVL